MTHAPGFNRRTTHQFISIYRVNFNSNHPVDVMTRNTGTIKWTAFRSGQVAAISDQLGPTRVFGVYHITTYGYHSRTVDRLWVCGGCLGNFVIVLLHN